MVDHENSMETPHRRRGLAEQSHFGEEPNVGSAKDTMDYHLHTSDHENDGRDGLMHAGAAAQQETHTRSLLKGFTWRIIATSTTTIIAWLVTGQLEAAFRIGIVEFFVKLMIYYVHERIWTRIKL
jgi:uncharacterized membrane protein